MTNDELKAWREGQGLSLAEAALQLGLQKPTYYRYEKGENAIPARVADLVGGDQFATARAADKVAKPATQDRPLGSPIVEAKVADALARADAERTAPAPARPAINPLALGWTPAMKSHAEIGGCDPAWDHREPKPGWQRIPGCIRVVHADIPDPLPYEAPAHLGARAVLTASGAIYDQLTGHKVKSTAGPPVAKPKPGQPVKRLKGFDAQTGKAIYYP